MFKNNEGEAVLGSAILMAEPAATQWEEIKPSRADKAKGQRPQRAMKLNRLLGRDDLSTWRNKIEEAMGTQWISNYGH